MVDGSLAVSPKAVVRSLLAWVSSPGLLTDPAGPAPSVA